MCYETANMETYMSPTGK